MTATIPVRVDSATYETLKGRADERHVSIGRVIADMLAAEEERRFWEASNADFAAVRADPIAWEAERAFRRELEGTLMDGLDDE